MSELLLQSLIHSYRSQKKEAEQLFDFFYDVNEIDTNVEEVRNKLKKAVEDWIDADLKITAIGMLSDSYIEQYERATQHGKNYEKEVFKN